MVKTNFKQTEIGPIPEDWEVKKLGEVLKFGSGKDYKHLKYGNIPVYGTGGIITFVNEYLYDGESVGIGRKGTIDNPIFLNQKFWTVDTLFYTHSFSCCIPKYIYYKFCTIFWKEYNEASGVPSLNKNTLESIQIPIPPLAEQQAIAEVLSDTDHWVENLEDLIEKKKLIKQATMQKLLTPKDDWEMKKLGEVFKLKGGYAFKSENFREFGTPIIRISDINGVTVELDNSVCVEVENFPKDFVAENGDILIAMSGATTGKIGKYCGQNKAYINQRVGKFGIYDLTKYSKEYLYHSLYTKTFKDQLNKFLAQGAQPNISGSQVEDILLHFPKSLEEQTRIATILSDMDTEIETLEQKLTKAQQIKQGLMQELLTGRKRLLQSNGTTHIKSTPKHNDHFNDAVLIGVMASSFASDNFPLTRFKYTKVSYLLKRYKDEQTIGYLKKAAGPYKPQTRYGGAEKIAINKKYVVLKKSIYKGKVYEGFLQSENNAEALHYFKNWYGENALEWIKQFKFETNDNLELLATVDMAMQDLKEENKEISLSSIKEFIRGNKEWCNKLTRSAFSDENIEMAIKKLNTLYKKI